MPIGAEVYRALTEGDDLSSGDIAYLTLARTRDAGELPPGDVYDPVGRVPAYPTPSTLPLAHGREVAVDTIFALVVTHSCEIDRQKNRGADEGNWDCRMTVAPIVPESRVRLGSGAAAGPAGREAAGGPASREAAGRPASRTAAGGPASRTAAAVTTHWAAIEANGPVASLFLPAVDDLSSIDAGLPSIPWPRAFADLRGLSTVSRRMVRADRLMGLSPDYLGVLQRQLARFFTWREVARHELVEAMVGRRIVSALPANPKGDRVAVALTADDGSSVTVELIAR